MRTQRPISYTVRDHQRPVSYGIDEKARALAQLIDGKLLLVTNVKGMAPEEVIDRYKSLADIERGFKVLKSELEIGPVYHRLPQRIRAHAAICFMSLILHRVMQERLRASATGISPERALQTLKRIQQHRVSINNPKHLEGVSSLTEDDLALLGALGIKPPTTNSQLCRL